MRMYLYVFFVLVCLSSCGPGQSTSSDGNLKSQIIETETEINEIIQKTEHIESTEAELDALLDEL